MVEVRLTDAFIISTVIATMVFVMTSMMAFFYFGMDEKQIEPALRTGAVAGVSTGLVVLFFAISRVRNHSEKGELRDEKRAAEVKALRSAMDYLNADSDGAWITDERVRRERGVLTLDMHGLNAAQASSATQKLIEIRNHLQRVRIVTGRGEIIHDKSADPGIRPAVIQRLRIDAHRVDWQVLIKSGSITLRPMGVAPTKIQWMTRFAVFVIPMCVVMGFSFRDLAGSSFSNQGLIFGISSGVLLTILLASYRDRSG
tara:strand:- start:352 stop:1122 length:771 start_codon:yes stop_codon:yes gene_type:complete